MLKQIKYALLLVIALITFTSCSKEDIGEDGIGKSTKTIPKFTSAETVSVSENQISALQLVATDEDKDTLTYSISGTDVSAFSVDTSTGVVVFNKYSTRL